MDSTHKVDSSASLHMADIDDMTANVIIRAFESQGTSPKGVRFVSNKTTGLPATYCFVQFSTPSEAREALVKVNGKVIDASKPSKRFRLNYAILEVSGLESVFSVFVGGLSREVDDQALYSFFNNAYPSVHGAQVVTFDNGNTRGFGFVRLSDRTEYERCLVEMDNTMLLGRSLKVSKADRPTKSGGNRRGPVSSNNSSGAGPSYDSWSSSNYYGGNNSEGQQQWSNYYGQQQNGGTYGNNTTSEVPEEPSDQDDATSINDEYMRQSGEPYRVLEKARWMLPAFEKIYATFND